MFLLSVNAGYDLTVLYEYYIQIQKVDLPIVTFIMKSFAIFLVSTELYLLGNTFLLLAYHSILFVMLIFFFQDLHFWLILILCFTNFYFSHPVNGLVYLKWNRDIFPYGCYYVVYFLNLEANYSYCYNTG
jgi:hypothetical protein